MDYRLQQIKDKYKGSNDGHEKIRISCPDHPNNNPTNCSVELNEKDQIVACCHSEGCDVTRTLRAEFDPQVKRGKVSGDDKKKAVWLKETAAEPFLAPQRWGGRAQDEEPLQYTSQFSYRNRDNNYINLIVVRYDHPKLNKKATIPFIFARLPDGREMWISRGPHEPTWFGSETLSWSDTVVIVEGEKCAKHLVSKLGRDYGCLAWIGGSGAAKDLDIDLLRNKRVILWPDADKPGAKWSWKEDKNLYDRLKKQGNEVSLVDVREHADGFDCADIEDAETIRSLLKHTIDVTKLRLASMYSDCLMAEELQLTEDTAKSIPCGVMTGCAECKYKYIPGIAHPIDTLNKDPMLHEYAYIESEERYVDLDNRQALSKSMFDNRGARAGYTLTASGLASRAFQSSLDTLIVNEREFRPGLPLMIDGKLNLAQTLQWPMQTDDPELWHMLGQYLFEPHELNHILDWLAFTIQKPHEKIEHTLLITGAQGAGKSLFFAPIEKALRRVGQARTVNSNQLQSQFNDYLVGTKLLIMEELNMAGTGYGGSNKLKEMQASPPDFLPVNSKGIPLFYIPNIVNIIAYSNFELSIKLEQNQRRWYVVHTNAGRLEDQDFYTYDAFNDTLSDHYVDKILSYLSRRSITEFKRGNAPRTQAAQDMEMLSIPGYRDLSPTILEIEWPDLVELREVKTRLEGELGPQRHMTDTSLRKILNALGWMNLGISFKDQHQRGVRPWAPARGEMYKQLGQAEIRRLWSMRYSNSQQTHIKHTNE
jgi:hypothetical protein